MKILVRLPNWLGDMVMSVGFVNQLRNFYPGAEIGVIVKKGIHELLPYFPPFEKQFIFHKETHSGLKGLTAFGKEISRTGKFDLFFSLPNSFSSALIGYAAGAEKRIGYKKELRQIFLTHAYTKPRGIHRAEEYVKLLELFTGRDTDRLQVALKHPFSKNDHIVVNINSEALSRRLTLSKAVEILDGLREVTDKRIFLIGAPKEKDFVATVHAGLKDRRGVETVAGATSLPQLVELIASAQLLLSTDSGPSHLANALGTYTIVLFGAGNENHTAPYNKQWRSVLRLGQLSCEPCEKNVCVRFPVPQCLEQLSTNAIIQTVKFHLL